MKQIDNIKKYLKEARININENKDNDVFNKILDAANKNKTSANKLSTWRIIMKSRITKLTTAAAIIIAVFIAINQFGGSVSVATTAYAAAIKALQNVDAVHSTGWTRRLWQSDQAPQGNYAIEVWEWYTEQGGWRRYESRGPLVIWEDGERRYKYDMEDENLFISKSGSPDMLEQRFRSIIEHIDSLKQRGIKVIELGSRTVDNKEMKGFSVRSHKKREDIWIDPKTNLVSEFDVHTLEDGEWQHVYHVSLEYNLNVPTSIITYVLPDTDNVHLSSDIDPRFEKWRLHLRKIATHYQDHPLPETMELLPRNNEQDIPAQTHGHIPGITDNTRYWAMALDCLLGDFLRGFQPGVLRVPEDLKQIKLNHDLITSNLFDWRERRDFVLDYLGLKIVETAEDRKVWVAHYDGRSLKHWQEVKAPISREGARATGPGMASVFGGTSMKDLFDAFVYYQGYDLEAKGVIIVDETGIRSEPHPDATSSDDVAVSSECPYWGGKESIEIAKKWFEEQFGVTFTEEIQPMTVYVVQRKDKGL